ncbi:MAG: Hsp70 family protein, partial [Acidobacteriota bacterium]|nr:Hsp70 family protein [Acidobacteriota bacterium]
EREIASANRSLGKFELVGIPPAARGVPQIDVAFEVDANGIVSVSAKDKMTGLEQAMQITPSSGLAPDEIDRLIMEAEKSTEADKREREMITMRNQIVSLVENTRKGMAEFGKGLPSEQHGKITEILTKAENQIADADLEQMKTLLKEVEVAAGELTEALMALA